MLKYIIGILLAAFAFLFTNNDEEINVPVDKHEVDSTAIRISDIEYNSIPKPLPRPTMHINTADDLYQSLLSAKLGDAIYIPGNISIDLTPTLIKFRNKYPPRFEIPSGVTLMGDGTRFGENGATLFVTDDVKDEVFRINSGARITGLKIKGPKNDSKLIGIQAYTTPGDTIIIDNCELWGWNQAAIKNRGNTDKTSGKNNMIIRNNYIHDTTYKSGYGIATAFNAFTLIEYNKFKNNKHDVSASGRYGCDYTFRYNTNIGQWLNPTVNKKSHSVDIHGWPFDANIKPENRNRNREAGSRVEIYGNHFKDPGNNEVIHIRGIPEFYVKIYNNKFASNNVTPIEQKYINVPDSQKNMEIWNNIYKVKF
jgi:hypothetical protein